MLALKRCRISPSGRDPRTAVTALEKAGYSLRNRLFSLMPAVKWHLRAICAGDSMG